MSKILTVEEENKLRKPIEDYVGKIQEKIDALRVLKEIKLFQQRKEIKRFQSFRQSLKRLSQSKMQIKTRLQNI